MTTLEAREIANGNIHAPLPDMAFSIDAGRVAHVLAQQGNCLVSGVSSEMQANALASDIEWITKHAYSLDPSVLEVNESTSFERVNGFNHSSLLIVSGLSKVIGISKQDRTPGQRRAAHQFSGLLKRTRVCAIETESGLHTNQPTVVEIGLELGSTNEFGMREHTFEGLLQPSSAISMLEAQFNKEDAQTLASILHRKEQLTYDSINRILERAEESPDLSTLIAQV